MTLSNISEYEDIYAKQVQSLLAETIEKGQISEAITAGVRVHTKRNNIMAGLFNRTMLDSASTDEWDDPREADGVPIFARRAPSSAKENHKLHTPFDRVIAMQKASYMVGDTPSVSVLDNDDMQEEIANTLNELSFEEGISELAQKASGRGAGYSLLASPPGDDKLYVTYPDEWSCFMIYDTVSGEPLYGVRYWVDIDKRDNKQPQVDESRRLRGEFYDRKNVYKFDGTYSGVKLEDPEIHLFDGVPLIEFPNNTERISDVELTMSLQDAYDIADSDISSEISQLRLAYLSLASDEIDVDEEWLKTLKKTGVFVGEGKFIEKDINSSAVENLKKDLEMKIYKYSNSYNPDELGQDKSLTAFQIQQKLLRLESSAKETELLFKRSLRRMLYLVTTFYGIGVDLNNVSWQFTRNTPRNALEDMKLSVESGFKFSQDAMARLLPYSFDQEKNKEELEEERAMGFDDPFNEPPTQDEPTEE